MNQHRDTIVIGASAGGVAALRELLARLRRDLAAAVLVVQHQGQSPGGLDRVLQRATRLPVRFAADSDAIERGVVLLAPPDRHLLIHEDRVRCFRGPRENRARPAINPLFRSAAAERGGRVIAALLTGLLDDGVAGLHAVQRCGGITVVQHPDDAEFPDMPQHALDAMSVDHVVRLEDVAELLPVLTREPAPRTEIPPEVRLEAQLAGPERSRVAQVNSLGAQVSLACSECGGPLWKVGEGGTAIYRCHVGHALSARMLLQSQSEELEHSLWAAVRTLTERAAMLDRLADEAERRGSGSAARFRIQADEAHGQSERARQFLLSLRRGSGTEAES